MPSSMSPLPAPGAPAVSFEFFPPTDAETERTLWASVARLAPLGPRFVSVTYGADGSTRERTHAAVARIASETGLTAVPHLTCVGARREEIEAIARRYWQGGVRELVALRGDPPAGRAQFDAVPGGFRHANELVAALKAVADFRISVAGYPETHPEATSPAADIAHLKAKCEAGAERVITQFFFEAETYLRFRDRCLAAGIRAPIVPGILPVTRLPQLERFARRCGASVPPWLRTRFQGLDDDPETRQMIAASVAIDLVTRLAREGVRHFHFYTLNRAELSYAICHALGLRPAAVAPATLPAAATAGAPA